MAEYSGSGAQGAARGERAPGRGDAVAGRGGGNGGGVGEGARAGGGTGRVRGGVSPASGLSGRVASAGALADRYRDYNDEGNSVLDNIGNFLGNMVGIHERNPLADYDPKNPNTNRQADWGFDPIGGLAGLGGMAAGIPGMGFLGGKISQLAGYPADINLGPDVFGSTPSYAGSFPGFGGAPGGLLDGLGSLAGSPGVQGPHGGGNGPHDPLTQLGAVVTLAGGLNHQPIGSGPIDGGPRPQGGGGQQQGGGLPADYSPFADFSVYAPWIFPGMADGGFAGRFKDIRYGQRPAPMPFRGSGPIDGGFGGRPPLPMPLRQGVGPIDGVVPQGFGFKGQMPTQMQPGVDPRQVTMMGKPVNLNPMMMASGGSVQDRMLKAIENHKIDAIIQRARELHTQIQAEKDAALDKIMRGIDIDLRDARAQAKDKGVSGSGFNLSHLDEVLRQSDIASRDYKSTMRDLYNPPGMAQGGLPGVAKMQQVAKKLIAKHNVSPTAHANMMASGGLARQPAGLVTGPGGERDDLVGPILLSSREYVMPASMVRLVGNGDHSKGVDKLEEVRKRALGGTAR